VWLPLSCFQYPLTGLALGALGPDLRRPVGVVHACRAFRNSSRARRYPCCHGCRDGRSACLLVTCSARRPQRPRRPRCRFARRPLARLCSRSVRVPASGGTCASRGSDGPAGFVSRRAWQQYLDVPRDYAQPWPSGGRQPRASATTVRRTVFAVARRRMRCAASSYLITRDVAHTSEFSRRRRGMACLFRRCMWRAPRRCRCRCSSPRGWCRPGPSGPRRH
jgi:hypothetical protein